MLTPAVLTTVATSVAGAGAPTVDAAALDMMERAKRGDAAAFAEVYDRYVDRIYAFVYRRVGSREVAEDVTADAFTNALRRIHTWNDTGADPIAWLFTIARNLVHDHFKSARFRVERPHEDTAGLSSGLADGPETRSERAAVMAEIQRALRELKPDHAEVLHLRFVDELSVAEVAEVLGRRPGAVRALQHRALKSLAKLVDMEAVT